MLLAASGLRIRVPGATIGATLAYSVYLTHKQVIHLDRIYLKGFVPLDGPLGFLVYGVTILIVGAILYVFVERPFLQGAVRQIWHREDERGACSLLEADCEGAAREIIGSLPLVKAGMLELVILIPLLPYRGFGPRS